MPEDLTVHDIHTTEQPFFSPSGAVKTQTVLTFFVGTHGPFRRVYDAGQGTTEKMQQDINSQVQQLRILTGANYGA